MSAQHKLTAEEIDHLLNLLSVCTRPDCSVSFIAQKRNTTK
jgi:hypothetical protein